MNKQIEELNTNFAKTEELIAQALAAGFKHEKRVNLMPDGRLRSLADERLLTKGPVRIEVVLPGSFAASLTETSVWTEAHGQRTQGWDAAQLAIKYGACLPSQSANRTTPAEP